MSENLTIILSDGRTVSYEEYGDPKGKPLFYLHGWPGSRFRGKTVEEVAKKLKLRIISPDRPGYGYSTFKPNRTLLDYPDDILELANYLKIEKFSVIGVSGGGPYAAVCAYKIPKRIQKIGIVVGLGPSNIKNAWEGLAFLNKLGWSNYGRIPLLIELSCLMTSFETNYIGQFSFGFRAPEDRELLSPEIKKEMTLSMREAFKQGIKGPALDLKLYTSSWGFDVNKINVPVYLWYGDADKNVSLNMAKYYAHNIKNAHLIIYPNEGHLCQITHADEILKTFS